MAREFSLYEAKARLSALVRQVREGQTVVITVHGRPAAELRPVSGKVRGGGIEARLLELESQGLLTRSLKEPSDPGAFPLGPRKEGALRRFLEDRE